MAWNCKPLSEEEREKRKSELMEKLDGGVKAIQSSDSYKELLRIASKFYNYSWGNWIMIMCQAPNASHVKGYQQWKELDRQVRKGEKAIKILAPLCVKNKEKEDDSYKIIGFRAVNVFDVSQTDGPELPKNAENLQGDDFGAFSKLADLCKKSGFELSGDPDIHANGFWTPDKKKITVKSSNSMLQQAKTLAHELAHAYAGHGTSNDDGKRDEQEMIAESVAFIVCDMLGLDSSSYSFDYVAHYAGTKEGIKPVLKQIKETLKHFEGIA